MTTKILDNNFKIIAYRGGAENFAENSIEAIQESVKSYADTIIEIDLQLTKDKVVVAFHDFHLDDLTDGKGLVSDFSIIELKKLFLKNPNGTISTVSKISTLEEIFHIFPNQSFVLDLHENNSILFDKVIEVVERNKKGNQIVIVSIANGVTDEFRKLRPNWTFIASPKETKKFIFASKLFLNTFVSINADIMFLPAKLGGLKILSLRAIKDLKRRNIKIWTCNNFKPYENVNTLKDFIRLKELGVDGVYTDNPSKVIEDTNQ
jgi:glycerophosphoryl diester phosphodiesterase